MKLNILILVVIILLGVALNQTIDFSGKPQKNAVPIANTDTIKSRTGILPDFSMTALDGKQYQSRDFSGKMLLINFWASWCIPCLIEFPLLLELARLYPDDLVLLAISSDLDESAIMRFTGKLDRKNANILAQDNVLIIHDKESRITFDIFKTSLLPETITVNRQQEMIHKIVGADWTVEEIKTLLEQ